MTNSAKLYELFGLRTVDLRNMSAEEICQWSDEPFPEASGIQAEPRHDKDLVSRTALIDCMKARYWNARTEAVNAWCMDDKGASAYWDSVARTWDEAMEIVREAERQEERGRETGA